MAEKQTLIRKAELAAELAAARSELTRAARDAGEDLNVVAHLKHSIVNRKTAWFTGAAVAGWVLSRLPGRRKVQRVEALPKNGHPGIWLALLTFVFKLLQPLLASVATRKIGQLAARGEWDWRR